MKLEQVAQQALDLAGQMGLKQVDVLVQRSDELEVSINEGKVEKVEQSTSLGLGIRVLDSGRSGFASTEKLELKAIERAIANARDNSQYQDPTGVYMPEGSGDSPNADQLQLYHEDLESLTLDEMIAMGLEIESAARNEDKRVTATPQLGVGRSRNESQLISSLGVHHTQRSNYVAAYCGVLLEDGPKRKSGMEMWSSRNWDPGKAAAIGTKAVEKGVELIDASAISGTMPIVVDQYCAPRLLGMYFNAFHGEDAQLGISRLAGKLGEVIAIPELCLRDDPHRTGAAGSRYVDAEGTPTVPLDLIVDGVFKNFIYHIEAAQKDSVASTGHAGRRYDSTINTRSHNLVMETGEQSLDELCQAAGTCLLVTKLEGGAGCNPVSGDLSIGVQGFLMKQGERVQAVEGVTIAGNFFDLLTNIQGIGDSYQPNLTSTFVPALLIDGLAISS